MLTFHDAIMFTSTGTIKTENTTEVIQKDREKQ